nr:hypothetical protein [Sunxiuqinia sp.]
MKVIRLFMVMALATALFTQCNKDNLMDTLPGEDPSLKKGEKPDAPPKGSFTVTIENVSEHYPFFESGMINTPVGESSPGPAFPGQSFTFSFHGGKGHQLSFATMYGISNDLFYGPSGEGLALFDGDTPLTGDITSMIMLWDAGTEVNEEPGVGPNTGPNQSGPNTGPDENGTVRNIDDVNDGFAYPPVADNIKVMLDYNGTDTFTLTIENLPGSSTPLSPLVWVVHSMPHALFEEGMPDYGMGLEHLAEDGATGMLAEYLSMNSGYVSPIAPGVWVVHKKNNKPIFTDGMPDYGDGLEPLAEMGDPSTLAAALMAKGYESGVFNTPDGAGSPGPLFPGDSYTFTVDGKAGEYLSFASMLGKSNDLFFGPDDMGIRLFKGIDAVDGDITAHVKLWDAGTEVNEYPGAGIHQGPGGVDEMENVMMVNDGFMYPAVDQMIKVTIMRN